MIKKILLTALAACSLGLAACGEGESSSMNTSAASSSLPVTEGTAVIIATEPENVLTVITETVPEREGKLSELCKVRYNNAEFAVGDDMKAVIEKIGPPPTEPQKAPLCAPGANSDYTMFYSYEGMNINVSYEDRILSITVKDTAPEGTELVCGLRAGDTPEQFRQKLGEPASGGKFEMSFAEETFSTNLFMPDGEKVERFTVTDESIPF